MMSRINVYEVVKKLIGPIEPVGESHTDNRRFENQKEMMALIDRLLSNWFNLRRFSNNHQASMKRAGIMASKYFRDIQEADDD